MAGKLDHLKIKKAPACFETWARNFNSQVDLLASIQGGPGIDVQIAHSQRAVVKHAGAGPKPKEQPRGRILLTLRPSAANGLGIGGGGTTNGVQELMIGPNGSLYAINVIGSAVATGNYPTYLQAGNGAPSTFYAGSGSFGLLGGVGNATSFAIDYGSLSHSMAIKEFTGCNSGSPANYLVVASNFY